MSACHSKDRGCEAWMSALVDGAVIAAGDNLRLSTGEQIAFCPFCGESCVEPVNDPDAPEVSEL